MKARKGLALLLALGMLVSVSGCASASALENTSGEETQTEETLEDTAISLLTSGGHSSEAGKEETVYVVADANGNPRETIVSDWLKNADGSADLTDESSLTDIENTKGDEDYTVNADGTLTWHTNGTDIYYQGKTDQTLPVDVAVSYELDGKTVTPEEAAGATGHMVIRFEYTNNTARQTVVDGEKCTIYQPYVMVSGLLLSNDAASNVTVTNGKVVNDGDRTIVVGMAMPGLSESLGLDTLKDSDGKAIDVDVPETVTVEADVTDFSLITTLTLASGDALTELGLDDVADLDDLEAKLDELTDGSQQLVDGTDEFSGYMGELSDATGKLSDGADTVDTYMQTLSRGIATLQSSVSGLPDGANQLLAGTQALSAALKSGYTGTDVSKYGVYEAVGAIADGTATISAAAQAMMTGASTVAGAADQIAAGAMSGSANPSEFGIYEAAGAVEQGLTQSVSDLGTQLATAGENLDTANGQLDAANAALAGIVNDDTLTDAEKQAIGTAMTAVGTGKAYVSGVNQALSGSSLDVTSALAALDGIQTGAQEIAGAARLISAGAKSNDTTSTDAYGLYESAAAVKAGADQLNGVAQQLLTALDTMTNEENLGAIISGLQDLSDQSGTLIGAVNQMNAGATTLADGTGELSGKMSEADSAVQELYENSIVLKDGMAKLDSDGIQQIADLVSGDLAGLLHRLQAVQDYAAEQTSFTGMPEGVTCSVKFIYKTDEISAD